ncbi:MAG: nucleotide pyrophosphohydrolase [Patescibacteria group bacterium]
MSDLEDLQKKVIKFRNERDWAQYHTPKELAVSLSIEAAELLEQFQWAKGGTKEYQDKHREEISDELADVFVYTLFLADALKLDLKEIVDKKMLKNAKKYPVDKAKGSDKKYTEYESR